MSTLAVIAHYEERGKVSLDLINLIKHLHQNQARIVFVSTCLNDDSRTHISPYANVIARDNIGYDFWSYKVGIESVDYKQFDRVLLLNSSFITTDPEKLCSTFLNTALETGLRGVTISNEFHPHIQSFWVAFEGRELICSEAFATWWRSMTPVSDRAEVIRRYELGMSRHFSEHGYRLSAAFLPTPEERFRAVNLAFACNWWKVQVTENVVKLPLSLADELNPCFFMWQPLVERHGLIKRDTLRRKYLWPDLYDWLARLVPTGLTYTAIHDEFPLLLGKGAKKTPAEIRFIDRILGRGVDQDGQPRPFTSQEFFERSVEAGFNQNDPQYRSLFRAFVQWCLTNFQFRSAIEVGAGPGYLTFLLNRSGIDCIGVDGNDYSMRYFQHKHPAYADKYRLDPKFILEYPRRDALFAIECFEHIPDDELAALMIKISEVIRPRFIFFSSTPHADPDSILDFQWGHINLKTPSEWDSLFNGYGYQRLNLKPPITDWACVYINEAIH